MTTRIRSLIRRRLAIGCTALVTSALRAAPVVVDGVAIDNAFFPDAVVVQGQALQLNGAGPAYSMGLKTINLGIYVAHRHQTLEGLMAEKGPKRIDFFFLRDAYSRDISNALLDRVRQNISREEFAVNILPLSELGGAFGIKRKFVRGDEMSIDYSPATQSTEFLLNHVRFGEAIQGEAFYSLLLKVFAGPNVRDRDALFAKATEP